MGRYLPDEKDDRLVLATVCNAGVTSTSDELLLRFWETKEVSTSSLCYMPEEQELIKHFHDSTVLLPAGRYQVKLPKKSDALILGESRQQAIRRFYTNENNLKVKGTLHQFNEVVQEYIDLGHAEPTHPQDPTSSTFYMPMHAVDKEK